MEWISSIQLSWFLCYVICVLCDVFFPINQLTINDLTFKYCPFFLHQQECLCHLHKKLPVMQEKLPSLQSLMLRRTALQVFLSIISFSTSSIDICFFSAFVFMMVSRRCVLVAPGKTLFTVIPNCPNSFAMVFAHEATAPRIVFDTPRLCNGTFTDVEMILMIRPKPSFFIEGMTALVRIWLVIKC